MFDITDIGIKVQILYKCLKSVSLDRRFTLFYTAILEAFIKYLITLSSYTFEVLSMESQGGFLKGSSYISTGLGKILDEEEEC